MIIVTKKLRFQIVFRPHKNERPAFSSERFRDGLVWAVTGLTVEIKVLFQISPVYLTSTFSM